MRKLHNRYIKKSKSVDILFCVKMFYTKLKNQIQVDVFLHQNKHFLNQVFAWNPNVSVASRATNITQNTHSKIMLSDVIYILAQTNDKKRRNHFEVLIRHVALRRMLRFHSKAARNNYETIFFYSMLS